MQPFERLVDSINRESQLTAFGQQAIPEMLIGFLINRLEVEDWYARYPEIEQQQIIAPVFGIGLPRTGSTALGHIMAQDPSTRVLRDWESKRPCPPPETTTENTDPRIAATREGYDYFATIMPEIGSLLPYDERGPQECTYILSSAFVPHFAFEVFVHVPSYAKWVASSNVDMRPVYEFHKRVIKLLQWRCPPRRWYLRTPMHSFALDAIDAVYPDAQFVMTHRDPVKALSSSSSLMQLFRSVYVENPLPEYVGKSQVKYWGDALKHSLEFRDRVGEQRFFDVSHRRQINAPAEQVRSLYKKLDWVYDGAMDARIKQWQTNNPKGSHKHSLDIFGLNATEVAQHYQFYTNRFGELF